MHIAPPSSPSLSGVGLPDWREDRAYHALIGADVSAFAWEWLRRTSDYRRAWSRYGHHHAAAPRIAQSFGLEDLENPFVAVPHARPVWSRTVLPTVLTANVADIHAPQLERVDLRLLARLVTIVIGQNGTEHLLFSDGRRFLRVDVVEGTLIGCPSSLSYLLRGLSHLDGPIASLNRLRRLVRANGFDGEAPSAIKRHHHWVMALRVADAIAGGNDHQTIARGLFGSMIASRRWRLESASYRRKVQRLVYEARAKLRVSPATWLAHG